MRTALLVLVAALAGPPAASATAEPRLEPLEACYISAAPTRTEPVIVSGTGFQPRTPLRVRVGPRSVEVRTNATGALPATELPAPYVARGQQSFLVAAGELRARPLVSALSVTTSRARGRRPVTWRGRGFTEPRDVYAHVLIDGRAPKDFRLATPTGACGTFSVLRPLLPADVRARRWTVQIDQRRTYRPRPAGPHVRLWFAYDEAAGAGAVGGGSPSGRAALRRRPARPPSASR